MIHFQMYGVIWIQHSIAKDVEVLMGMRLQNALMKTQGGLMLAISPGALVYGELLRLPVVIITMPLSSSGLISGSPVLIRWVLVLHYLATMFSLTEYFHCFMQLEGRGSQGNWGWRCWGGGEGVLGLVHERKTTLGNSVMKRNVNRASWHFWLH